MLEHGGGILAAARRYRIPAENWLDLSTGLNPHGWPVPPLPAEAWQRLPQSDDGLEQAAAEYYGSSLLLPVAGSQAAIQALPGLRPASHIGLLDTSYAEHAHAWTKHGHQAEYLQPQQIDGALEHLQVLLLCHPNNPTGWRTTPAVLEGWRQRLAQKGGWLIVDEAFIDSTPQDSLIPQAGSEGLVILRSIGKFFGLAGARAGFVFAWQGLLEALAETLGPWTISGPARQVVRMALQDHDWQQQMRRQLAQESQRLQQLLQQHRLTADGGCHLFQWRQAADALPLHEHLARQAILSRYFPASHSLRLGLPDSEQGWSRLDAALAAYRPETT
jgi:cobalamin biosynthetic protein CobC